MRVSQVLSSALLLAALTASVWGLEFPDQPIYQGTLQDGVGSPLQGYHDLEFRFYSTAQGREASAVVSFDSVEIVDGKFTVAFEDGSPEPDFPWTDPDEGTQAFLSITVDGNRQTARLPVSTDRQAVFVLPDDGDGTSPKVVCPFVVPTVAGDPVVGSGGDESAAGLSATTAIENLEPPESVTLAKFTLANGNTVEFVAVPELGDVGVIETAKFGDDHESTIAAYQDLSALEIFQRVAPAGAPIPPLLLDLEAARYQESGEVSGPEDDPYAPPEQAEDLGRLAPQPEDRATWKSHCGGNGAQYFMDNYCDSSGFALKSPIRFCDHHYHPAGGNSVWYSLIRNSFENGSFRKRWNSHGITGSCSTSVKVFHFFWGYTAFKGWQWKVNFSHTVDAGHVDTTLWFGGSKRYRRIERFRLGGSGGFRAATTFYNNL